ncbi:MAG: hypothetical protein JW924_05130 [Fusobacteriaceae bacterium]|nr:hypothetical protein [Fusobacteriaceae bacterium]
MNSVAKIFVSIFIIVVIIMLNSTSLSKLILNENKIILLFVSCLAIYLFIVLIKEIMPYYTNDRNSKEFKNYIKDNISDKIIEKIKNESAYNDIEELRKSLKNAVEHEYVKEKDISMVLMESIDRLDSEIVGLNNKASINLLLGLIFAAIDLIFIFLSCILLDTEDKFHLIQQSSFALSIGFFAFFFLRIYISTLPEIKYYRNEIINFQYKFISIIYSSKNENFNSTILENLISIEKNKILKKGETTAELERNKQNDEFITKYFNLNKDNSPSPKKFK